MQAAPALANASALGACPSVIFEKCLVGAGAHVFVDDAAAVTSVTAPIPVLYSSGRIHLHERGRLPLLIVGESSRAGLLGVERHDQYVLVGILAGIRDVVGGDVEVALPQSVKQLVLDKLLLFFREFLSKDSLSLELLCLL